MSVTVTRTANAGVLLELDGVRILLDGICEPLPPYLGTPEEVRERLTSRLPDVLAFTHKHPDHYDDSYANAYMQKTLRPVFGPESLPLYADVGGGIRLSSVETRHIGRSDVPHVSFVIEGSARVWFMGDASPASLRKMNEFSPPDLLIVPFAYAITPSAWKMTKEIGARKILLVHMPLKENDKEGLWNMVLETTEGDDHLEILKMQETVSF